MGDTLVWRGLPYAQPPVGAGRWRPPSPLKRWDGVRDATRFGPRAIQDIGVGPPSQPPPDTNAMDEDCLYLNVCSPASPSSPRPVVVWIHAGGFATHSGAYQIGDGSAFAIACDVTVVSFNYRLGCLGFLPIDTVCRDAPPGIGNTGLLDQLAALRWVRENISAFGGDPGRVTIMGCSAGGKSVGVLLGLGIAGDLFHTAISMSGGASTVYHREEAADLAENFLSRLGLRHASFETLQSIPTQMLIETQRQIAQGTRATWIWRPVVDGVHVPRPPLEAIADGAAANVPLLAGTTRYEGRFFALNDPSCLDGVRFVVEELQGSGAQPLLDAYIASHGGDVREALVAVMGDERYRIPTVRLAEAHARFSPTWLYRFDWRSPALGSLGAAHGSDVPVVWDLKLAEADTPVVEAVQSAWGAFAHTGSPVSSQLPEWPTYHPTRPEMMLLDQAAFVVRNTDTEIDALWRSARPVYPNWPSPAVAEEQS